MKHVRDYVTVFAGVAGWAVFGATLGRHLPVGAACARRRVRMGRPVREHRRRLVGRRLSVLPRSSLASLIRGGTIELGIRPGRRHRRSSTPASRPPSPSFLISTKGCHLMNALLFATDHWRHHGDALVSTDPPAVPRLLDRLSSSRFRRRWSHGCSSASAASRSSPSAMHVARSTRTSTASAATCSATSSDRPPSRETRVQSSARSADGRVSDAAPLACGLPAGSLRYTMAAASRRRSRR